MDVQGFLIIGIVVLPIIYFYFDLYKLKKKYKDCFMPFHFPIIGISYLIYGKNMVQNSFEYICKQKRNMIIRAGFTDLYYTLNPDEIKIILHSPKSLEKSRFYRFGKALVGDALITAPVEVWKPNRKVLSKSFIQNVLDQFVPTFNLQSKVLINKLKKDPRADVMQSLKIFTLHSFVESAFGFKLKLSDSDSEKFLNMIPRMLTSQIERVLRPWEVIDSIYAISSNGKRCFQCIKELKSFFLPIIEKKKRLRSISTAEENEDMTRVFKDFIDLVLDLEESGAYTEKSAMDEIIQIVVAATDTSGATLAFAFVMMAMHQDIQQKLYEEIISIVGSREVQVNDLKQLKYTERFLNETMRLFPVVPMILREVTENLDIGTRVLEAGTNVLIGIFQLQRFEKYWPDPLKFDPDRFLPEEMMKRNLYSFLPFSSGSRNCIGLRYSYMIMKATVANIVRKFKVETDLKKVEDVNCVYQVFLTSDNLQCTFVPR